MFNLLGFTLASGQDVVAEWLAEHAAAPYKSLCAKLDVRMYYLRQQPRNGWSMPMYRSLTSGSGVGEIRFEWKNVQYRPLGFFGPGPADFTFLFMAREVGGKFVPLNSLPHSISRMTVTKTSPSTALVIKRWANV